MAARDARLSSRRAPIDRSDLPVLLAAADTAGDGETSAHPLDRVRMQKGVFLLTMGGPPAWRGLYDFSPYNWGPYSGGLARDLDRLRDNNILRVAPVPGSRYGQYVPTAVGQAQATRALGQSLTPDERRFLNEVRTYVTSRSFDRLLADVYREYPEYATESLFRPWRTR